MKPITKGAFTAIGGASVGAVLGVAVDDAIHGSLGMSTTLAIACCVSVIALLFLVSGLSGTVEKQGEALRASVEKSASTSKDASELMLDKLQGMWEQRKQTIEYQLIDSSSATAGSRYEEDLTLAVKRAEREILVLDLLDDSGQRPANAMDDDLLADFLDVLIGVAVDDPAVLYHRITQTPSPDSPKITSASATYVRHCTEMCLRREAGARNVLLRAAGIRYPFKFILIDRTSLMLQLNRLSRDGENRREAWCEIFFANTDPQLIRAFVDMWEDVGHDPRTRTVTSDQIT